MNRLEIIPINADLNAVYTYWDDGAKFRRQPGWWDYMKLRGDVAPEKNETLLRLLAKGLSLRTVEHVSFTLSGKVIYTYDTTEGTVEDIGLPGEHNVEHGRGYLSPHAFTRVTDEGHSTCCIVRPATAEAKNDYLFEILTDGELETPANFVHYCLGSKAKQTEYNVPAKLVIKGTAIIGKLL